MTMTYNEAVAWIHSRLPFGIKPGIERMTWLMGHLGNPHLNIKAIHVAGTNGKGSTVTYLRSILEEEGFKVGTFTSPYIETFNERISVNGHPITDEEIAKLASQIRPLAEELGQTHLGAPTEFEIITAMSFLYFGKVNPMDYCIYEVGLGGRYDSTNIIMPLLSIITNIGFDHMNILGNSIEEIAAQKAGIIKPLIPVVTTVAQKAALDVIEKESVNNNAPLSVVDGKDYKALHSTECGEVFTFHNEEFEIQMLGLHQVVNASLAIRAIQILGELVHHSFDLKKMKSGLMKAFWLGRFERISTHPLVILDGAHNEEGVEALVATIKKRYENKKITILFSALGDKQVGQMLERLKGVTPNIYLTTFDFPRAMSEDKLIELTNQYEIKSVVDWKGKVKRYFQESNEDEVLIITGSLYFISEVRNWMKN